MESPISPGLSSLRALANLINSAVDEVTTEYGQAGKDLPSLDSLDQDRHPLLNGHPNLKLLKSVKVIQAACAQMSALVSDPGQALLSTGFQHTVCASLNVVCECKIADHLRAEPEGVSIHDLATRVQVDEIALGAIMKTLATNHIFREVRPNVFTNNRRSALLTSDNPTTALISLSTDENMHAGAHLYEAVKRPSDDASSRPSGFYNRLFKGVGKSRVSQDFTNHPSAFQKAMGQPLYDWYSKDPVGKGRMDNFHQAMIGLDINSSPAGSNLITAFPWGKILSEQPSIVVCDIGGSTGSACLPLLRQYSSVKLIVQDLPHTIPAGQELWRTQLPEALEGETPRVQFMPLDFFEGTPVKDGDYYYLRHIMHNWPDNKCSRILSSVVKSMKPSSRVLIHEHVSQHVSQGFELLNAVGAPELPDPDLSKSPAPLLPNFGMGNFQQYAMDICMIGLMSTYQRTFKQFSELATKAGLEFVASWPQGEKAILEFKLASA